MGGISRIANWKPLGYAGWGFVALLVVGLGLRVAAIALYRPGIYTYPDSLKFVEAATENLFFWPRRRRVTRRSFDCWRLYGRA